MVPFRWRCGPALAAVLLLALSSPGTAKINEAGSLLVPTIVAPKYCSGAFRYAARLGNSDIVSVSPVQVFAADRRLARTRYTSRAMAGFGTESSVLLVVSTMCG